jgi:hypothetical protein
MINDKELNEIFNKAKMAEPVVDKEFARSVIDKPTSPTPDMSNINKGLNMIQSISIAAALTAAGVLIGQFSADTNIQKRANFSANKLQNSPQITKTENAKLTSYRISPGTPTKTIALNTSKDDQIKSLPNSPVSNQIISQNLLNKGEDVAKVLTDDSKKINPVINDIDTSSLIKLGEGAEIVLNKNGKIKLSKYFDFDFKGVNYVRLNRKELLKLGIMQIPEAGITMIEQFGKDNVLTTFYPKGSVTRIDSTLPFSKMQKTLKGLSLISDSKNAVRRSATINLAQEKTNLFNKTRYQMQDDKIVNKYTKLSENREESLNELINEIDKSDTNDFIKHNKKSWYDFQKYEYKSGESNLADSTIRVYIDDDETCENILFDPFNCVPIEVPFLDENGNSIFDEKGREETLVFWFEPSLELLFSLPIDVANRIMNEIATFDGKKDRCVELGMSGSSLIFDNSKSCNGAIEKMKVYPIPAKDNLNVSFNMNLEKKISIIISGVDGNFIDAQVMDCDRSIGDYVDHIDISKLNPGIYLLTIKADSGESVTQRFIVR